MTGGRPRRAFLSPLGARTSGPAERQPGGVIDKPGMLGGQQRSVYVAVRPPRVRGRGALRPRPDERAARSSQSDTRRGASLRTTGSPRADLDSVPAGGERRRHRRNQLGSRDSFEVEDFGRHVVTSLHPAHERPRLATGHLFHGADESIVAGVLKEQAARTGLERRPRLTETRRYSSPANVTKRAPPPQVFSAARDGHL
jgi:hypothetical protein